MIAPIEFSSWYRTAGLANKHTRAWWFYPFLLQEGAPVDDDDDLEDEEEDKGKKGVGH